MQYHVTNTVSSGFVRIPRIEPLVVETKLFHFGHTFHIFENKMLTYRSIVGAAQGAFRSAQVDRFLFLLTRVETYVTCLLAIQTICVFLTDRCFRWEQGQQCECRGKLRISALTQLTGQIYRDFDSRRWLGYSSGRGSHDIDVRDQVLARRSVNRSRTSTLLQRFVVQFLNSR
jgi:hypothetical protein